MGDKVRYEIDAGTGVVTVTMRGKVDAAGILAGIRARMDDPEYRPGMHLLVDARGAWLEIGSQDVRTIVSFMQATRAERGSGFRFALVSDLDVTFGVGRMFQAYAEQEPEHIQVFRELEPARRWVLGAETP